MYSNSGGPQAQGQGYPPRPTQGASPQPAANGNGGPNPYPRPPGPGGMIPPKPMGVPGTPGAPGAGGPRPMGGYPGQQAGGSPRPMGAPPGSNRPVYPANPQPMTGAAPGMAPAPGAAPHPSQPQPPRGPPIGSYGQPGSKPPGAMPAPGTAGAPAAQTAPRPQQAVPGGAPPLRPVGAPPPMNGSAPQATGVSGGLQPMGTSGIAQGMASMSMGSPMSPPSQPGPPTGLSGGMSGSRPMTGVPPAATTFSGPPPPGTTGPMPHKARRQYAEQQQAPSSTIPAGQSSGVGGFRQEYQQMTGAKPAPAPTPAPANTAPSFSQTQPSTGLTPRQPSADPNSSPFSQGQNRQKPRIDPDAIPSVVQVLDQDRRFHSRSSYATNSKQLPPLSSTEFTANDQGNSNPKFIRSSLYQVPVSEEIATAAGMPIAFAITPLAEKGQYEKAVPVINCGEAGPIRCRRCKGYMNPFVRWANNGNTWQCNLCEVENETPAHYFAHLDHTGRRQDIHERPELGHGTVDYVATVDYCARMPVPLTILYVIEATQQALKCGMVDSVIAGIKGSLDAFPKLPPNAVLPQPIYDNHGTLTNAKEIEEAKAKAESETSCPIKVGFITFNRTVQFFSVRKGQTSPSVAIMPDIDDPFGVGMPGSTGSLADCREEIDDLLDRLPQLLRDMVQPGDADACTGAAVDSARLLLEHHGGRIELFSCSMPNVGPGKLKHRDDPSAAGTDKERQLLVEDGSGSTKYWDAMGLSLVEAGIALDTFVFPNSGMDLAALLMPSKNTGGSIYRYPFFNPHRDDPALQASLKRLASRDMGYEGLMRLRSSPGLLPTNHWGNFHMANRTDVQLAGLDADKTFVVEVNHDDRLKENSECYVQVAVLYTSAIGYRRIRVLNLALTATGAIGDIFRNADLDAMMCYWVRKAALDILTLGRQKVKERLNRYIVDCLSAYRKHCAANSSPGQLILPEGLKLLPVYSAALFKQDILRDGKDCSIDARVFNIALLNSLSPRQLQKLLYPKLYMLTDLTEDSPVDEPPRTLRLSMDRFRSDGAYLLDNGATLIMWIGERVHMDWLQSTFGTHAVQTMDTPLFEVPVKEDSPLNCTLRELIKVCRDESLNGSPIIVIKQRDALEPQLLHLLAEDVTNDGPSYVDHLCNLHRFVQARLS
eukprot:Clim_evm149s147 gene=Clim_evmTU149s147